MLKSLLYYRPAGRSWKADGKVVKRVSKSVVQEAPQKVGDRLEYSKPAIWNWISRATENNVERRRFFANVYDITTMAKTGNKAHEDWYEKRNAIVHGRDGVLMTLSEYQAAETHIIDAVLHLVQQCEEKYKLQV